MKLSDELIKIIIETYNHEYSEDDILLALEFALNDALYGRGFFIIDWGDGFGFERGDFDPSIYYIKEDRIIEVENIKPSFLRKAALFLSFRLSMLKALKVKKEIKDIVRDVIVGEIKAVAKNGDLVVTPKLQLLQNKNVPFIAQLQDQPLKERSLYREGQKLLFFVKRVDYDPLSNTAAVFLSRTTRTLATKILKHQLYSRIMEFYVKYGRYPTVFCYKRVAGKYSKVLSEIHIPKKVLQQASKLLWNETIIVES